MSQAQQVKRVRQEIGWFIREFANARLKKQNGRFHLFDLEAYVIERMAKLNKAVTPGSPGRILRLLKAEGQIKYTLLSRPQSYYTFHK